MSNFTKLFLENFIGGLGLESLGSALPTISVTGGSSTTLYGTGLLDNNNILGSTVTSTGTAISLTGPNAYEQTKEQLQLAQAYIESLDEQQLSEMIAKLENKNYELSLENIVDNKANKLVLKK